MVQRHGDVAGRHGLAARDSGREGLGEQVVGAHPPQGDRDALAAAHPRAEERARDVPAPARLEHRRREDRLHEQVADRLGREVFEDVLEREAVLRPERQDDRLLVRGRLQLEAEPAAEPLAQRQAEGAVDAAAERRVQDHLGPARLVEEPLEHDAFLRRGGAERGRARGEVLRELRCRVRGHAALRGEPRGLHAMGSDHADRA